MNLKKILALALAAAVLFTGCENRREETGSKENSSKENNYS